MRCAHARTSSTSAGSISVSGRGAGCRNGFVRFSLHSFACSILIGRGNGGSNQRRTSEQTHSQFAQSNDAPFAWTLGLHSSMLSHPCVCIAFVCVRRISSRGTSRSSASFRSRWRRWVPSSSRVTCLWWGSGSWGSYCAHAARVTRGRRFMLFLSARFLERLCVCL